MDIFDSTAGTDERKKIQKPESVAEKTEKRTTTKRKAETIQYSKAVVPAIDGTFKLASRILPNVFEDKPLTQDEAESLALVVDTTAVSHSAVVEKVARWLPVVSLFGISALIILNRIKKRNATGTHNDIRESGGGENGTGKEGTPAAGEAEKKTVSHP